MSTTPDTSPQASNDRARYGPFASANTKPKETLTNGATSGGLGTSVFGTSFQSSGGQGPNPTSPKATNQSTTGGDSQGSGDIASDVSLGSPTKKQGAFSVKNRSIAQPRAEQPHIEEKAPIKNPFAGLSFPAPKPTTPTSSSSFFSSFTPNQKQSLGSPQPNGDTSSLFANPAVHSTRASGSSTSRQPGMPPEPPAHFTEDQKRQLITGWRLKSLDVGFQSYLQHSSYSKEEIESVTNFYELRKQAILDANGGPLPEVGKKRAAQGEQLQNGLPSKKARHQQPDTSTGQPNSDENMALAGHSSPSKRKANEALRENDSDTGLNGLKRSKPDDQITYPSLPSTSSSSKTAKIFGDLVGKKSQENSSDTGNAAANEHASTRITPNIPASSSKPSHPQSDLFFKAPTPSSGASEPLSTLSSSNKQAPLFGFGKEAASISLQSKSENQNTSSQVPSTQTSTPLKGFFPSQPNSSSSTTPTSSSFIPAPQGTAAAQSSNNSSIFSGLNNGVSKKRSPKRKAEDDFGEEGGDAEEPGQQNSEEQRSKKQKAEEDHISITNSGKESNSIFKAQTTKERAGFGESIFARSSIQPGNAPNMFSHLTNSTQELDDYEDEDDNNGEVAVNEKAKEQINTSSMAIQTPKASSSNPSGSSVFNPFGSSTFNAPPEQSLDEGKPAGQSLFDRIGMNQQGQPAKVSKPVNFGESILKTPAGLKSGSIFGQNNQTASNNPFGATISTSGSSISGSNSSSAATNTPSATPAFNMFGKPSGSNNAPVANMSGNKAGEDSPSGDNTWKPGTPVRFADSGNAPIINFTSPSPSKSPFTGLFGTTKANMTSEAPGSSIFRPVDSTAAKPAQLTFGISAPAKDAGPSAPSKESNESLAPPSETQSESTSRATSPGATEGEAGNESSDVVRDKETHPELDVTEAAKAEADEDVIFDEQGKVYKYESTGADKASHRWVLQGNEQFRVLKHRDTNKTRMVMKLKVNGRVILNAGLQESLSYVLAAPKKVRVPVPINGKVETWLVSFGKEEDAKTLVSALEENKAY